jgi:hypothetical protein
MIVELSGDYKALNRDNIYDYILKRYKFNNSKLY